MSTESLTYAELGNRLGTSPEAARSFARRMRLPREPGNDGRVRVIVDLSEIQYTPLSARSPRAQQTDIDGLNAQIKQLQGELAKLEVEKQCVEARAAGHRTDFERERDRCDTLTAETLNWTKVAITMGKRCDDVAPLPTAAASSSAMATTSLWLTSILKTSPEDVPQQG